MCTVRVGRSASTGFLIGPDLVLTCDYTLREVGYTQLATTELTCVFDYRAIGDGTVGQGQPYAAAQDWLVTRSPAGAAELGSRPDELPHVDELDFAVIRLAGRPGLEPDAGGRRRGWMNLLAQPPPPAVGIPLLVLQHPREQPMKLSFGATGIVAVNANGTRVSYTVDTLPGSSGAPCFASDLRLLAVHQGRDPDGRKRGVPVAAIAAHLRATGHAHLLGG